MASAKYSRVPTDDTHVIDFGDEGAFDYSSTFDYGVAGQAGSDDKYKSAFSYKNWRPGQRVDIPIMEVEGHKSLMGMVVTPIVTVVSYILLIITLPLSAWFTFRFIKQYERLVVFRLGKLQKVKGPGLALTLPCIDRIKNVDVRTKAFSVPPQKTITSDGATIEIGADIYHQVYDAVKCVTCVKDFDHSVRALCQLCLQKALSKYALQQTQSDQVTISRDLTEQINVMTAQWGIKVTKVQLSPVKVIQEPNALLEGCNLMNAPLDWLGPLLFPPGTTHLPVKPLQDRGLLPQHLFPGSPQLSALSNSAMAALGGATGPATLPASLPATLPNLPDGPSTSGTVRARISPHELLTRVQPFLKASLVHTVNAIYVFRVKGEDSGEYYLDLKHGEGDVGVGLPPGGHKADVTLTLSSNDLQKLFSGEMSAFQAYVSGRLKIDGDLQAAMALQAIVENLQIND